MERNIFSESIDVLSLIIREHKQKYLSFAMLFWAMIIAFTMLVNLNVVYIFLIYGILDGNNLSYDSTMVYYLALYSTSFFTMYIINSFFHRSEFLAFSLIPRSRMAKLIAILSVLIFIPIMSVILMYISAILVSILFFFMDNVFSTIFSELLETRLLNATLISLFPISVAITFIYHYNSFSKAILVSIGVFTLLSSVFLIFDDIFFVKSDIMRYIYSGIFAIYIIFITYRSIYKKNITV